MGSGEDKDDKTMVVSALDKLKKTLEEKGLNDGEIMGQLQALETMSKEGTQQQPVLTHKSLNQLQKAEKQYAANKIAIKDLDTKWKEWSDYLKEKFHEQGKFYKEKRKILLEKHHEMKSKLVQLREEVQKAATTRKDPQIEEEFAEVIDLDLEQELILSSDDEEMKTEQEIQERRGKKTRPPEGATAASPSKVPKKMA